MNKVIHNLLVQKIVGLTEQVRVGMEHKLHYYIYLYG